MNFIHKMMNNMNLINLINVNINVNSFNLNLCRNFLNIKLIISC